MSFVSSSKLPSDSQRNIPFSSSSSGLIGRISRVGVSVLNSFRFSSSGCSNRKPKERVVSSTSKNVYLALIISGLVGTVLSGGSPFLDRCMKDGNGNLIPYPRIQTTSDLLTFFVSNPSNSSYEIETGFLDALRAAPIENLLTIIPLSHQGFTDIATTTPSERAWLRSIWTATSWFIGQIQNRSDHPLDCPSGDSRSLVCGAKIFDCASGEARSNCEELTQDFLDQPVFTWPLNQTEHCGNRQFSYSEIVKMVAPEGSVLEEFAIGNILRSLSLKELLNLKQSLTKLGNLYNNPIFRTLYRQSRDIYRERVSKNPSEAVPCPEGALQCESSPVCGPDDETNNVVLTCFPPLLYERFDLSAWPSGAYPFPVKGTLSLSNSQTVFSSPSSTVSRSVSRSLQTQSPSKDTSATVSFRLSRSLTKELTQTSLGSPSLSQTQTFFKTPYQGNCTKYAEYRSNTTLIPWLGSLSCGPGGSTRIDWRSLGMTEAQITMLSKPLGELTNITELILFGNSFGPNGVAALADHAISNMHKISYIHMDNTNMQDKGAQALASAINQKKGIKFLIVRNNDIGPSGGMALARSLGSAEMVDLWVGNNFFGDEAVSEIGRRLASQRILPSNVGLSPNNYSLSTQAELNRIMSNITNRFV